jgi:hypothetical protein
MSCVEKRRLTTRHDCPLPSFDIQHNTHVERRNGWRIERAWRFARPSRPFSCCCGLNQPRVPENGWVLAILTAFRVAPVQRKHVPWSISSGQFPEAAHEGTPTA